MQLQKDFDPIVQYKGLDWTLLDECRGIFYIFHDMKAAGLTFVQQKIGLAN